MNNNIDIDIEDILWNIDSAYCFVINGSSEDLHQDIETEYQQTVHYVNNLYTENKQLKQMLIDVRNLVCANEDDVSKDIVNIIDLD